MSHCTYSASDCLQAVMMSQAVTCSRLSTKNTPLQVVMIWPLFILGEVQYIREGLGLGSYKRHPHQGLQLQAALQASFCFVDTALLANLIEVYCVSAGLWSWKQENCLGVPWIGALGWGLFATPAVIIVSLLEDVPWGSKPQAHFAHPVYLPPSKLGKKHLQTGGLGLGVCSSCPSSASWYSTWASW